ncbi:E3 ubiquitin-protein ligase XIAP-like isoform X2 [Oncorhynchus masou masou]|uniref:E3 ubiquitin-protein ligase XIAP-like isoform X2 n=1 Tax=Oncorhynchus masou masou TaxID=90313 RepID=UPI0031843054
MSGPGRDSDLESDHAVDWSMMDMRLDSFRGSPLAQQVSAERLARAGFYFTGQADKVRCFSCHKTVENWCGGDTPAERHAEVSPNCKFLSCTHRSRVNSLQGAMLTNEPHYNEDAEDMEFRLRTGEVVDESTYPMVPHMVSEDSRFNTLGPWPSTSPVRPRELAQAGLFYLGESDRVQCFCCGGMLGGWEPGDTAWGEHSKHFPYCFFILGHDVGNLPSQAGREEEVGETRPRPGPRVPMQSFEERLGSFAGIQHPIDHERLARAGFYNTGAPDRVVCFCCGGGLKGWQPDENPWEEHAKHYPGERTGVRQQCSVKRSWLEQCCFKSPEWMFKSQNRGAEVSHGPEGGRDGSGACPGREDHTGEDTQGWDRLHHPGDSAAGLL